MKAFVERAIEVRDKRNQHVRIGRPPVRFEHPDRGPVIEEDCELQHLHQLRATESPAGAQHGIVEVLYAYTRIFLEYVERIEQFLQVRKLDSPGAFLRPDGHFEGCGSGPVATASVEEAEFDASHSPGILALEGPQIATGVLKRLILCRNDKIPLFSEL